MKRLLNKMDSIKATKSDDISNCMLNKLSISMAIVNKIGSIKAIAQLWNEFVLELRFRWDSNILISGISLSTTPDLSQSLLHQKLQMLNCCIQKKIDRDDFINKQNSPDTDLNESDEFFDCDESDGTDNLIPDGRLKQCDDLYLLNRPTEPLYIPQTQESTPMTEDMIDEHANVLVNLGCSSDAALLRAKIQSASLLSDMESFKAANPGCILEDFVRWYSPRDFVEVESSNSETNQIEKRFELSNRMKIAGNMWIEVWNSAKSVPVRKEKRLFDDTKEAEKVFEWLNMLTICNIVQELLPMLFYSSVLCVLKESKEIINDYEGLVDSLIDKTIKVTRNNRDDVKKYIVKIHFHN
jgi:Rab3 GTPase-activating protein catalytic subunit